MKKSIALIILTMVITACSLPPSAPSDQELDNANYGTLPKDWKDQITKTMKKISSPDSVVSIIKLPEECYQQTKIDNKWVNVFGYCAISTTRNSSATIKTLFFIYDGKAVISKLSI